MEELLIPLYSQKQINMASDDLQEAEKIRKDIDQYGGVVIGGKIVPYIPKPINE